MFIIFGLKSVIKQLLNLVFGFFYLKCGITKQLLHGFGFCDMQNYHCQLPMITLTSTLIILHITKASSSNCLLTNLLTH